MISDITLGQYLPGKSWLHRMDPRMKIILSIVYIVAIFLCKHVFSYALILLFTGFLIAAGGIPFKFIRKSLKPIVVVLIITSFINLFWTEGSHQIFSWEIASWWTLSMYWEGVWKALFMVTRVVLLVISVSLFLTYTTSPIQLTDALESLLSPLKVFKIPVHEFAMMMTIALRFIPTLIEETERIMNAQKSRGSDLSSGSLLKRVKAMIPILVPLFISAFQRAMDFATAMECRCYRGGDGRTKLVEFHLSHLDFIMLALVALLTAGIPLLNYFMPLVMQIGLGL